MLGFGSLSRAMAEFLRVCVQRRRNMVTAGGTDRARPPCLNLLSNFIADGERIITIEDAADPASTTSHLVALEARPAKWRGVARSRSANLVRDALRRASGPHRGRSVVAARHSTCCRR